MLHFATWQKSFCNAPFNESYRFLQGADFTIMAALLSVQPALQARAFTLVNIFNCGMDIRCRSSYPKNGPNCARCCWRARVLPMEILELQMQCLGILDLQMYFFFQMVMFCVAVRVLPQAVTGLAGPQTARSSVLIHFMGNYAVE